MNVSKYCWILPLAALLSGCGILPLEGKSSKYVEIAGHKYRKTGAPAVSILMAGVRRNEGVNYFEPKKMPAIADEVTASQRTIAFNEQSRTAALEATAEAGVDIADIDATGILTSTSNSIATMHVFTLDESFAYVDELNKPENRNLLDRLAEFKDPRIITSVAVVFDQKSTQKIEGEGKTGLKIKNPNLGNPSFSVIANNSVETLATLSDGTIFAYQYSRICWKKKDGVTVVSSISLDEPSSWRSPLGDDNCPKETNSNASKL